MLPLLKLEDVSLAYHSINGETLALSNISFQVKEGEFIAIVGPSGCGKSTLLSMIAGLLKPESGSILLRNEKIKDTATNIGYMLQKDYLFEWRSIYSNVMLGLEIQKKITPEAKERVEKMLVVYGLEKFKDAKPSELSGGMRQRVALVRTLALEPELLLLDEPFSALDYQTRLSVCDDISSIIKKEKRTAILVTHDLSEAISTAERVIILSKRPGSVKKILPIIFEMEDKSSMSTRNAPEFKDYFNSIWKELNE
jgi:ABC-type nitrate/sulfonate/bicarbonate transport system, ATPase component